MKHLRAVHPAAGGHHAAEIGLALSGFLAWGLLRSPRCLRSTSRDQCSAALPGAEPDTMATSGGAHRWKRSSVALACLPR